MTFSKWAKLIILYQFTSNTWNKLKYQTSEIDLLEIQTHFNNISAICKHKTTSIAKLILFYFKAFILTLLQK